MSRTSSSAVQGVLLSDYDGTSSLTPFIDSASVIVDRVATCASDKGVTLTAGELELIERWVAAHAYVMVDQTYKEKHTGRAKAVFQGLQGMRLEATKHGQMALSLDPSGCLAAITSGKRATLTWLGKPPSEQTDYVDRD